MGVRDEWHEIAQLQQHHITPKKELVSITNNPVEKTILDRIEIHAADHCVQRCKMCSHAADIAPKKLYGPEDYEASFNKLKEKDIKIGQIEILGGEPFINPRLEEIIDLAKQHCVRVVLMSNMYWLKSFYDIDIRANIFNKIDVFVATFYETLLEKTGGYEKTMYLYDRLKHKWQNIEYVSFTDGVVKSFAKIDFSDEPKPVVRLKCMFRGCKQLLPDGRILGCCAARRVMYTRPQIMDVFDINQDFNPEDLIKWHYRKVLDLCKYCSIATEGPKFFDWKLAE